MHTMTEAQRPDSTRTGANRVIRAPRGATLSARSWLTEAPLRMIMNNLDPEVAECHEDLVVYGGIGKAARNWDCFDAIVATLRRLGDDETLLVQSGRPVGVFRTHTDAPRVLIANSNLVPHWATWEHFNELDRRGLMMFGPMTGRARRQGRRPAAGGDHGRRFDAGDRMPAIAHRQAAGDRLPRRAGRDARCSTGADRCRGGARRSALHRAVRQRCRTPAGTGKARRQARRGDRPDLRA